MLNPLLKPFVLPDFTSICPKHILPAMENAIERCRHVVKDILSKPRFYYTWSTLFEPLASVENDLNKIWSTIDHLNSVKNSKELRYAYEKSLLLLSEYRAWIKQNKELYNAYQNLSSNQDHVRLDIAQKKTLNNILRDFELSGINLPSQKQQRYIKIVTRLSELSSFYRNNVLDSTMSWSKSITDKRILTGVPQSVLDLYQDQAKTQKKEGWLITLDLPNYLPILTYCDNAKLRKELYYAYNTRASDQGPNAFKWDNGPIIREILALRLEMAKLLGFRTYIDKSLVTKMVKSSKEVMSFLTFLVKRVRSQAIREFSQLCIFSKKYFGCTKLKPWDIRYYSEKQKQHLFSIDDEQFRVYFPESRVITGLFEVVKRIYGISIKERKNVDFWDSDVRFFDLFNKEGQLYGSFYLDLYVRQNKQSGAWMKDYVSMIRKSDGNIQKPVAYLVCNFNRRIADNKPALFTHNEVTTLFHEFGHVLHHILTCIDIPDVSGINGIPYDAIELPSQLMENYCWQSKALSLISGHYETDKPLPKKLMKKLIKSKNYQSAILMLRQLEYSLFDFFVHDQYQPERGRDFLEIWKKVKKQVSIIPTVSWERFPNTFNHIFSDDYAAGYYGYLWADVLATNVWSRFEEEGIFNQKIGKSFLDTVLSKGGSEEPIVLFKRFQGKEPNIDIMLRYNEIYQ